MTTKEERFASKLKKFCHKENIDLKQFKKWFIETYMPDLNKEIKQLAKERKHKSYKRNYASIDYIPETQKDCHCLKIMLEI